VGPDDPVAREWYSTPKDRLLSHSAAVRFRKELLNVSKVGEELLCVRGRRDDRKIKSWKQMGPPCPGGQPPGRYNSALGDNVLYLADSKEGVLAELKPKSGERTFFQWYRIPATSLQIGDFASSELSDFMTAVFDYAENEGRCCDEKKNSEWPFSQALAKLIRQSGFDGIIVPGVRGSADRKYKNINVFAPGARWRTWALRDSGFSMEVAGSHL
jgi:hypothetical protein